MKVRTLYKAPRGMVYCVRNVTQTQPNRRPAFAVCVWMPRGAMWYNCCDRLYPSQAEADAALEALAKQNRWEPVSFDPNFTWKPDAPSAEAAT